MSNADPKVRFLLLKDFKERGDAGEAIAELRRQLCALPDFEKVELSPSGESTVVAWVPARNQRQRKRLKALMSENVAGWQVIEEQSYKLPATF